MSHPWYAFYPKDYRDKTSGLTMLQDGAYRRLMDEYYITGEPLQANASILFRVCRAFDEAEQAAVLFILEKYFVLGDDGYHHFRIDEEIIKRAEISAKRASAGKLGGKSNKQCTSNSKAIAQAKAKQLPTQSHTQSHTHKKKDSRATRFEEFWSAFPKRVGKGKAEPAYLKAIDAATEQQIIDGATRYARSRVGEDPTFTVHPTTWLNQKRWTDEFEGDGKVVHLSAFNSTEEQENQRKFMEKYNVSQA